MIPVAKLLDWTHLDPNGWSYRYQNAFTDKVVFELAKLPNFAEPRFKPLGEHLEERKSAVVRRQTEMLMKLYDLGPGHALCLRYRREGNRLRLYVIVRTASAQPLPPEELERLATHVQQGFPSEYHPERVTPDRHPDRYAHATQLGWARFAEELIKPEEALASDTWPYYYVTSLWQSVSSNDMESFCRALLTFDGEAAIELLLLPTTLHPLEREFVNTWIGRMRESSTSGEKITSAEGKVVLKHDPRPALRSPLENYEKLIERYSRNRLFLYSFRVFAAEPPSILSNALVAAASRSRQQTISVHASARALPVLIERAHNLDINPEVRAAWWNDRQQDRDGELEVRPFRAQRLHRLADIEEVAPFWRLPIPVAAGFPGFDLDVGAGGGLAPGPRDVRTIRLGDFTDDPARNQQPATFDRENLAKHGLIVGVPGSGKTTTMFSLLDQLWPADRSADRVPFIVLEPAKTEYRALKQFGQFRDDLLVFTLGDERLSPFRFNPFEVPLGIPLESHIARLNACFVGAFNLFDPLPLLLDKSIRQTYDAAGWYDDSLGGDLGLITPTLSDLVHVADQVIKQSGYSDKLRDDFNAALLQRLESLRRGSKGRMLDTRQSIPFDRFMNCPVVMELDALNEDEKSLLMMFVLSFVYEYARSKRKSGSPLSHVLVVEEAHNLIGRGDSVGSEYRANPKEQAIRLFVRMLAEMRALGQGILIADQLPTALAPEAVKQTNLKVLMRLTAMDDRVEIGNTMDVSEAELKDVVRFKSGQAYVYVEEWDRVRQVKVPNFKDDHKLGEPPDDATITELMRGYEDQDPGLFMPYPECSRGCMRCNRRLRSQAERFVRPRVQPGPLYIGNLVHDLGATSTVCKVTLAKASAEARRLSAEPSGVDPRFAFCAYVHFLHLGPGVFEACTKHQAECNCHAGRTAQFELMLDVGQKVVREASSKSKQGG